MRLFFCTSALDLPTKTSLSGLSTENGSFRINGMLPSYLNNYAPILKAFQGFPKQFRSGVPFSLV